MEMKKKRKAGGEWKDARLGWGEQREREDRNYERKKTGRKMKR